MIYNTHLSQFIFCNVAHRSSGTWSNAAGQVPGTVVMHKAAAAQTTILTFPILVPSSSIALQGAKLASFEVDYEVLVADCTSITAVINKVTRGVEGADAVVVSQPFTQSPTPANSVTVDEHRLVLTITTPFWVDNDQYVLCELTIVFPATTQFDLLGAVANFTLKV
jgi:hypothetical protein